MSKVLQHTPLFQPDDPVETAYADGCRVTDTRPDRDQPPAKPECLTTHFSPHEVQVIVRTICQLTATDYSTLTLPNKVRQARIPASVQDAIANRRVIATERLEALRMFTTELFDQQGQTTTRSRHQFQAAGFTADAAAELQQTIADTVCGWAYQPYGSRKTSQRPQPSYAGHQYSFGCNLHRLAMTSC